MLVYRVETVEQIKGSQIGYGAYRCEGRTCAADLLLAGCDVDGTHPTPNNDAYLCKIWPELWNKDLERDFVFCFSSYNQLENWFYIEPDRVQNVAQKHPEIHVGVYYVPDEDYHKGHLQAIANMKRMVRVGSFPIGTDSEVILSAEYRTIQELT